MRTYRKGLSPLIASVLLIAFTMAVAAILTAWVSTFTKTQTEKAEIFEQQIDCSYSNLETDPNFAAYDPTDKVLRLYVSNTGTSGVALTNVTMWKLGNNVPELPKGLDTSTELFMQEGKTKILYMDMTQFGEPSRVRILTSCDAKWTTAYRPSAGWNVFDYTNEQKNVPV